LLNYLAEIFEVEMAVGSVGRLRQAISDAVAMPVAEVHEYVQQQAQVSIDETSFQQGNADGQNPTGTFMLVMGCGDSLGVLLPGAIEPFSGSRPNDSGQNG